MPRTCRVICLPLVLVCSFSILAFAQNAAPAVASQPYPDSADGLQSQIRAMMETARGKDDVAFRTALDSLAIPNHKDWFAAHFDPRFLTQLTKDYVDAITRYQSHISWVAANFVKFDDFTVNVSPSESPSPLGESGFESLLPRPLDAVKIENYRLSSASSDPKHGPPSWVSSFVYIDGRFRYVGGTYPFWAEGLNAFRGPMSLPPALIHGRNVQGIAFRKDEKGAGIDAIVQLKIGVDRSGHASRIKVLSGDPSFVEDAKDYIKAANFGPLPDIPQLANAKREWEFEVAFFAPKK